MNHANTGGTILTNIEMLITVGELLIAQIAGPTWLASAFPRSFARSVYASGVSYALGAVGSGPADAASARARSPAAAVFSAASLRADC